MRRFLIIRIIPVLLALFAGFAAGAQNQNVTCDFIDTPMSAALHEIEVQTGLSCMFEAKSIDLDKKVSGSFSDEQVSKVLASILGKDVQVSFQGSFILIYGAGKPKPKPNGGQVQPLTGAAKRDIRGQVLDAKTGKPLMAATISIKGTSVGTLSDTNGRFSIKAANGQVLLFQILGYESQEVLVSPETGNVVISMEEETLELESVVVTALGITRSEKSVGYAVSKVNSDKLNTTVSNNWLNGLDGKVAGLTFENASTGPGGSVRATLRGEGSLNHDKNEVLFVIDGVPVYSGMTAASSGTGYGDTDAPIDYGNAIGDINPEDIASVTVLKGPAATALYGSQAANGAIVISTKNGKDSDGRVRVELSSSLVFERAGFWPDFQEEYGAGNGNAVTRLNQTYYSFWTVPAEMSDTGEKVSRLYSRLAFGPRFEGQMFYNYDSAHWVENNGEWTIDSYTRTPWVLQDWYKGAFETGYTTSNTLAISYNSGRNTSIRFSLNDKRNDWILPNVGYTSQNFTVSLDQKAGNRIRLAAKMTYHRKDTGNLPTTGYNNAAPMYNLLGNTPSTAISSYKEEYFSGRLNYLLSQKYTQDETGTKMINYTCDSIYMILYGHTNSLDRDRVFGNASISIDLLKGLSLLVRSGVDLSTDFRTQRKATYAYSYVDGFYKEQTVRNFLMTSDALLTYAGKFKSKWDVNATLGASSQTTNYNNVQLIATRLDEPNVFLLQNSLDAPRFNVARKNKKINSLFGTASFSYDGKIFVDLTGRNDWSSTLARGNWSYFYPSVSTGILLDKILHLPSYVDILKLRASWANVGNDTDPYNLLFTYSNSNFPSSYIIPSTLQNKTLRPENVESWEVGVQTSFLKKRVGIDLAWYKTVTTDQIIQVPADYITGASAQYINAGNVTNQGVEVTLSLSPVWKKDLKWTLDFNWSLNRNKLVELAEGVDVVQMNSTTVGSRVYIYAFPGTELGRIYGQGYKRAPEGAWYVDADGKKVSCAGQKIIDPTNGFPVLSGVDMENLLDFGSIYPDWKGGISSTLTWKRLRMTANFTYQKGGNAYSITHFALASQGKLKNTLEGRYAGLIVDGVIQNPDGTYTKNDIIVDDIVDYYTTWKYSRNNVEENVFDTSFFKFKELRLDYSVPRKKLEKIKYISGASIGVFATNIFCITDFPIYDPEAATMTGASVSRGMEACAYPMTRTYGMNLKLAF